MRGIKNKYRIVEQTLYSGKKEYVVQKKKNLSVGYTILFLIVPILGWILLYDLVSYGKAEIARDIKFDDLESANKYINEKIEEYKKIETKKFMNSVVNRKIIR